MTYCHGKQLIEFSCSICFRIFATLSGQIFDRMNRIYRIERTTSILSINSGNVISMFENISLNSDVTRTMLKRTMFYEYKLS